jgi:putative tricarboxylic transport membrane protein
LIETLITAIGMMFTFENLVLITIGVIVGGIAGAIPGMSGFLALALVLPFTFYMPIVPSMALLLGVYKGGCWGGSMAAILLSTPGTPEAAADVFDGYPLAKKGKAGKALWTALTASVIADFSSDVITIIGVATLASVALLVGPPEYVGILLLALTIIGTFVQKSWSKGLIAVGLGLIIAAVGMDPITGQSRFTFGVFELTGGIGLIPIVLGLFAISEIFYQFELSINGDKQSGKSAGIESLKIEGDPNNHRLTWPELRSCLPAIFRSTIIGSAIGAIPGLGATVSSFFNYAVAKRFSKHPEEYGKGSLEGLAAAEAGNSATVGPTLIPLITLGIPGSGTAALFGAAFLLQGLMPGPTMMKDYGDIIYGIFMVMLVANIINFLIGGVLIRVARKVLSIKTEILLPIVFVLALIGAFAANNSVLDVGIAFFTGAVGYIFRKMGIPLVPIFIAFVLGSLIETNLRLSLIILDGNLTGFLTRPIAMTFIVLAILSLLYTLISRLRTGLGNGESNKINPL